MSKFVSTEGNCGPPIVLSREPIPKPDLERDDRGDFVVYREEIIERIDHAVRRESDAGGPDLQCLTVVAKRGDFVLTFHHAWFVGTTTRAWELVLSRDCIVTWEKVQ